MTTSQLGVKPGYRQFQTGDGKTYIEKTSSIYKSIGQSIPKESYKKIVEKIIVSKAKGEKCDRCWHISLSTGTILHRPELCTRCAKTIDEAILSGVMAINAAGYYWTDSAPINGDQKYLPMTDHIDFWCAQYGETYRSELEATKNIEWANIAS
jgi:hypothetical protein